MGAAARPLVPDPREPLGRMVRDTWIRWASEQPDARPSWLLPWEELDAGQREVDMRIGAAIARSFQGLLAAIWLYVDWGWLTRQLTTTQKDLWADAIDAYHARASMADPDLNALPADRWWRDG